MYTVSDSWAFRTQMMCFYLVFLSLQHIIFMVPVTRCSAISPIWKSSSSCISLLGCRWPHTAAGHFLSLHACSPDNPRSKWWPPVQIPSLFCSAKQYNSVKSYKMKNTRDFHQRFTVVSFQLKQLPHLMKLVSTDIG